MAVKKGDEGRERRGEMWAGTGETDQQQVEGREKKGL